MKSDDQPKKLLYSSQLLVVFISSGKCGGYAKFRDENLKLFNYISS